MQMLHLGAVQAGDIELRSLQVYVAFKVTGLNEVTKGVSVNGEEKVHMSKGGEGSMKESGAMLGMLGHLEFDLARTEANLSPLTMAVK